MFVLFEKLLRKIYGIKENELNIISVSKDKDENIVVEYKETISRVVYKDKLKNLELNTKQNIDIKKCSAKLISKNLDLE
nr:hypothetical protein GTC16762_33070 [Pigmentibacter ruber]